MKKKFIAISCLVFILSTLYCRANTVAENAILNESFLFVISPIVQVPDTIYVDEEDLQNEELLDADTILFIEEENIIEDDKQADTILLEKEVKSDSVRKGIKKDTVFVNALPVIDTAAIADSIRRAVRDSLYQDSLKHDAYYQLMHNPAEISERAKELLQMSPSVFERLDRYRSYEDTIIVDPIFLTPVFTGRVFPENYKVFQQKQLHNPHYDLNQLPQWLASGLRNDSIRGQLFYDLTITRPSEVKYMQSNLPSVPVTSFLKEGSVKEIVKFENVAAPEFGTIGGIRHKKVSYWIPRMVSNLQFSQISYSENWGGGQDNMNLRSEHKFTLGYNPFKKFTFNMEALWILNINNAPEDTMRSFRIIEDRFLVTANIGLNAFKGFRYTMNTRFETQLFNNFNPNSNVRRSAFLSPARFNLGVGMSYGFENKKKNFGLGITLDPISYNLTAVVKDETIPPEWYGVDKGHKTQNNIGSTFRTNWWWNIVKNVRWESSVFYFTSYEFGQGTWDNTFRFTINRLLSATLVINANYDDRRAKDNKYGHIQYQESLNFGLTYVW